MLEIGDGLALADEEYSWQAIRAQGAGGQNVNKVSSAVHLRFDIGASSLPAEIQQRLLDKNDRRISKQGVLVLKAQRYRSQEQNLENARQRLAAIILQAAATAPARKPTKPSRAARQRRVDSKVKQGRIKSLRRAVARDEH